MFPTRSLIAGSALATDEVKLDLLSFIQTFAIAHPSVHVNVHIDDIALDADGRSEEELVKKLGPAARDMLTGLQGEHQLAISEDKAGVVASSTALARTLCSRIGPWIGKPMSHLRNLASTAVLASSGEDMPEVASRRRWISTQMVRSPKSTCPSDSRAPVSSRSTRLKPR